MTQILRAYRGDDRTFTLGPIQFDGETQDLSNAIDIVFTARKAVYETGTAPIELHLFDGVEYATDGTDGGIKVSIPGSGTAALPAGTVLLWDVEVQGITSSGDAPTTRTWPEADGIPQLGKLVLVGDVTRNVTS